MPIFRYTFKKMCLTPSTWIITVMSIAFITLVNSLLIISLDVNSVTAAEILVFYLTVWKPLIFFVFLGLMLFIFIAVKATQVFRDEIDDGTLLILVSKPVSRTRIWTEKLFALQIMIFLFMFLSIFISSIFVAIPGIGSWEFYIKMFPYMWILFGVGIIFDLIVSSIAVLLSLVLNAKAIIAIMIGFAALLGLLSSSLIMNLFSPSSEYMIASQAAAVYSEVKNKLEIGDLTWLDSYINDKGDTIKNQITDNLTAIYIDYIPNIGTKYPNEYDPKLEQEFVTKIAKDEITPPSSIDVILIKHMLAVANIFRQWSQQSFSELLTGEHVGHKTNISHMSHLGMNTVDYSVDSMKKNLNLTINQAQYENANTKLLQTKILRYLNIFYHLKYIWDGIATPDGGLFIETATYNTDNDPYLFSWKKDNTTGLYQVDTSKKVNSKIISFAGDLSVYLVIGLVLLGLSWFVFNRKDFA